MNWKQKAAVMRICSRIPFGARVYKWGQKNFGTLSVCPMKILPVQVEMTHWLKEYGESIKGRSLLEVGTGHIPLAPIGFFLSGAKQIITVDLHRRIDWGLTRKSLKWIASHRNEVESLYQEDVVSSPVFKERFAIIEKHRDAPQCLLEMAGIEYLAPMDAAKINFPKNSIDYHFSINTLEHINARNLRDIFFEARRILKSKGVAIHFIDLTDHFYHQDKSISSINFLKYSDSCWDRIAGNEFAYCNRLRPSDYYKIFSNGHFKVLRKEITVDEEALDVLNSGFELHPKYRQYTPGNI
jgi:hypothetical protein